MSIIKYVTLQKIVAHDFRYDPHIIVCRTFFLFYSFAVLFSFVTLSVQLVFSIPYFKPFKVFLFYFLHCPVFITTQSYAQNVAFSSFFLKFKSKVLVKWSSYCWMLLLVRQYLNSSHTDTQTHPGLEKIWFK